MGTQKIKPRKSNIKKKIIKAKGNTGDGMKGQEQTEVEVGAKRKDPYVQLGSYGRNNAEE